VKDREATLAIRTLAERQHGVVAHHQLLDLEIGRNLVLRRNQAGLLVPLYKGIYALGHQRLTREGRWMAAVLACGPGAVLSHFSAGHLWGMCGSYGSIEVLRQSAAAAEPGA